MQEDEFNLDIDSILAEFSSVEGIEEEKTESMGYNERRSDPLPSDSTVVFRPEAEATTHFAEWGCHRLVLDWLYDA